MKKKQMKLMMKRTKQVVSSLLVLIVLVTFLPMTATSPKVAQAQEVYKEGGNACVSGNKVFFLTQNNAEIKCYNTKTKKVKTILDTSKGGIGFSNLTVKGKYIYFTWNRYPGSEAAEFYVYRMNLNGKKRKKLACGTEPVIAGNKVIYLKCKRYRSPELGNYVTKTTNDRYVMSLKGKNKKKYSKISTKSVDVSRYYGNSSTGNLGGYVYTLDSNQTSITRENVKTDKIKTIFSNKKGIIDFSVAGNYVYVRCFDKNDPCKGVAYVMKNDGTKKVKVASWIMAG